jgi:hypothetical protein
VNEDILLGAYALVVGGAVLALGVYVLRHLDVLRRFTVYRPPGMTDRGVAVLMVAVGSSFVVCGMFLLALRP